MVRALGRELELQREYLQEKPLNTLYFGGGTPSLLPEPAIEGLIETAARLFRLQAGAEITLEANPDDISAEKLAAWKKAGINRLSIGIQSFFEEDLQWMNRAHNAEQALRSLELALEFFPNITIDLIYGTPALSHERWNENLARAIALGVPHLSCYALTVEPKTPLDKLIRQEKKENIEPGIQSEQFLLLMDRMRDAGYEHYEISNFAKPGWRSRHNSAYWSAGPDGGGEKYLGIGPSAHSYNGGSRQWNVANNQLYIRSVMQGTVPFEKETLTRVQRINEYIMTSLRTREGLQLDKLERVLQEAVLADAAPYLQQGLLVKEGTALMLSREGKLLADGIAAALFRDEE